MSILLRSDFTQAGSVALPRAELFRAAQRAFVVDPLGERGYVARLRVAPGDRFQTTSGERCLLSEDIWGDGWARRKVQPVEGQEQWYRWAYFLTLDWRTPSSGQYPYCEMFEIHPAGNTVPQASPKIGFRGDAVRVRVSGGPLQPNGFGEFARDLSAPAPFMRGGWVEITLHVLYGIGLPAMVRAFYRNGGMEDPAIFASVLGPNLIHEAGEPPPEQYLLYGLYRNPEAYTSTIFLDDLTVADHLEDLEPVDLAALEARVAALEAVVAHHKLGVS